MFVDFNILNQLGSPSINSNTFANRPAAGQTGRLFVSIDTFEIYRDNGTTWDLIGGPGSSTVTGTGAATQVAYWTAAQAIGGSNNLWWDNTNGYLGVKTNAPTAGVNVVQTDGLAILSDFTTVAGSGNNAVAIYGRNTTNSSGYVAVLEEKTPNSAAGQYPIKISHTLSSGTAAANMATGIHFGLPDDAGTERIMQMSTDTVDPAAATYSSRYRFLLRNAGAAATPFYITGAGIGVYKAAPSGLIHADGGANVARIILDADNNVARIFSFRTDDLQRWAFRVDGNETGTNAGADLQIRRYNDAGTFIDAPVQITRSTGHVGIGGAASSGETLKVTGSALIEHNYTQTTGVNRNGIFSYLTTTTPNGASYTAGIAYTAVGALHNDIFQGSATIPRTVLAGGLSGQAFIQFNSGPDTVTIQQGLGGQLRSFAAIQANFGFSPSQAGCTVTHASGFHAYAPIYTGANNPTVTNYYGIALNDTTEYSALTITNRWGVYQAGASDLNYMAANLLLGSTVNNGNRLQVTGNSNFTGNVGIGTTSPNNFLELSNLSATGALRFSTSANTAFYWDIGRDNVSTGDFLFRKANGGAAVDIMRIDNSGNLGLGVTPSGWSSGFTALQVKNASLWSTGSDASITANAYYDGSNYRYIASSAASRIYHNTDSSISFSQAPSGTAGNAITFTQAMTLDAGGRLSVGTVLASGDEQLLVSQSGTTYVKIEGTQNNTVGLQTKNGNKTYFTGTYYNISDAWEVADLTASGATRLAVTSGGNFLIGTTTDAGQKLQVSGTGLITGNTTVGNATASTNVEFRLNGVVNKAQRIHFQESGTDKWLIGSGAASENGNFEIYNTAGVASLTIDKTSNLSTFGAAIKTSTPTGGTAAAWKLGSRVAAAVALDATQYIELDVGGTLYKLAIVT